MPNPELAQIEVDVLGRINKLGIGPMGYGGNTTCLDVFFEIQPVILPACPWRLMCSVTRQDTRKLLYRRGGNAWQMI